MDCEVSINANLAGEEDDDEPEIESDSAATELAAQIGEIRGENPLPPAVGMEFDSYDDVYYFYNCYAKEQGFGVRVSNTWYRKGKEKYRAKLSCSSAGFKKKTEANRPRPETRTGCPAMIKFRLTETRRRWRVIEVELDHNHLISPGSGKFYKSHKSNVAGAKRALRSVNGPENVQKIRLFRTVIVDPEPNGTIQPNEEEPGISNFESSNRLKLRPGDSRAVQDFFCRYQLTDPNFFHVVDLNERGCLRSLFWAHARTRAAYGYFGDTVCIDTACLAKSFRVPMVSFVGVNHHGQSVILGCGLLSGETVESYTWLLRAWLTCMSGRPPQVVITERCDALQIAVGDVFPRASQCLCLSRIMQKVPENLGALFEYEEIKSALERAVYYSLRPEEFESAWGDMIQRHRINDQIWLNELYEERKRWVPAYLKDVFLAGMFPVQPNEVVSSFFEEWLEKDTPLKEFLERYDRALQKHYELEASADLDSRNSSSSLKTGCYFELQLSKLYTNNMRRKFEDEVTGMYSCFCSRELNNVDGPIMTYIVKEQIEIGGNRRETRDYEVLYNPSEIEVLCVCGVFNFRGYLCRHALSVLSQNGLEEIPAQYILPRWRKDIKRTYVLDNSCNGVIDVNNAIHRYDHLYKSIVQVVEEGRKSRDRYEVASHGLAEILNKLRLAETDFV